MLYRNILFTEEARKILFLLASLFLIIIILGNLYFLEFYKGEAGTRMMFSIVIQFVLPLTLLPLVIKLSNRFPIFNSWKFVTAHFVFCFFYVLFFIGFAKFFYHLLNHRFVLSFSLEAIARELNRQFLISGSLAFMFYWSTVVLSGVQLYFRALNRATHRANRLRNRLTRSTLATLTAQLRPHFLFNTLSMVDYQIRTDPDKAIETIVRLQDLLENTLDQNIKDSRSIRDEIIFLDKYFEIQKSRFKTRLEINYSLIPESMEVFVPSYLFQPLVENSIKHGVAKSLKTLTIVVACFFDEKNLRIEISDDGVLEPMNEPIKWGIGLKNIDERLKLFFGEKARLEIGYQKTRGFRSIILIPNNYIS